MPELFTYGSRRKLPGRRKGYNQKFSVMSKGGRVVIHLRTSNWPDGGLGEIFVDANVRGDHAGYSGLRPMMNMFAVVVSVALQHGAPLETLVSLFTFTKFEPAGVVHGHDWIKMCTSLPDLIFRDLAIHYLDRKDLAHVQPGDGV